MRRLVVIVVLLGVMLALDAFKVPVAGKNPLTLAAIGFVLLTAFTVAELGSLLKLPRVTGYIVSGLVLGPSVANILSREVVSEMKMFNTLALGLIAVGAGLELDVKQLARVWRTLFGTTLVKVLFGGALVSATFYVIQRITSLLPLGTHGQVLAMSLIVGALSIGTSPAISLAVMNETKARGRLMDLVLGSAVLKDLVVVVTLAVCVAIARPMMGDSRSDDVLMLVAQELGSSILAGVVLGALLIAYIRFVGAEMLLFVAAMILVVSEVGKALHLELLLVFITAGFVVRNFSKHEHDLMPAVELVALPVFVVFFTNAGAGIDLAATWTVLPLALALCAARLLAYVVAARVGGKLGGESELLRKIAWQGYLPQAGVTLGLTGLAAAQLPQIGSEILTTGMAVVALNLLIGPVTLRRALKAAGEIPESPETTAAADVELAPASVRGPLTASEPAPPDVEQRLAAAVERMRAPAFESLLGDLYADLESSTASFASDQLLPWTRAFRQSLDKVLAAPEESRLEALSAWVRQVHTDDVPERAEAALDLFRALRQTLRRCPEDAEVLLEEHNRKVQPGDRFALRWRKRGRALRRLLAFGRGKAVRHVPVRVIARRDLEPRLAALSLQALGQWCRAQAVVLDDLRGLASGQRNAEEVKVVIQRHLDLLLEHFRADSKVLLIAGIEAIAEPLGKAGGPELHRKQIRLSVADPQIRETLREIEQQAGQWKQALDAEQGSLRLTVELAAIEESLGRSLEETVLGPAATALETIGGVVANVRADLSAIRQTLPSDRPLAEDERSSLLGRCRGACDDDVSRALERGAARLRAAASAHLVALEARNAVERLPESLLLARTDTPASSVLSPDSVRTLRVSLRSEASDLVIRRLLPAIDEQIRSITTTVAATAGLIREATDVAQHALESHGAEEGQEGRDALRKSFDRAVARLDQHIAALNAGIAETSEGIRRGAETALDDLGRLGDTGETGPARVGGVLARLSRRAMAALEPSLARARAAVEKAGGFVERIGGSQLSQDIRRRVVAGELDASDIREQTRRHRVLPDIPKEYARLFRLEPVREHRLFTAYEDELRALLAAERSWLMGGVSSALLVGAHGAGRTSMLNLCELELSAPRLIRPEPLEWRRGIGLVGALAIDLGVKNRVKSVIKALAEQKTTILLDDFEHWFTPDVHGLRELEGFLDLVIATRESTFWLCAVSKDALIPLEESLDLREPFAKVVQLEPLDPEALARAIEGRHLLSGRTLQYPSSFASSLLRRLRRTDERLLFFDVLARVSEGNLSRAYATWLRSLAFDEAGGVEPGLHRTLSIALPFMHQLPSEVVGMLVQMLRFGPMNEEELMQSLRLDVSETRRHVCFLVDAGLVERHGQRAVGIPAPVRPLVAHGLKELGVAA